MRSSQSQKLLSKNQSNAKDHLTYDDIFSLKEDQATEALRQLRCNFNARQKLLSSTLIKVEEPEDLKEFLFLQNPEASVILLGNYIHVLLAFKGNILTYLLMGSCYRISNFGVTYKASSGARHGPIYNFF